MGSPGTLIVSAKRSQSFGTLLAPRVSAISRGLQMFHDSTLGYRIFVAKKNGSRTTSRASRALFCFCTRRVTHRSACAENQWAA